jgi:hypothetical protein
MAYCLEKNCHLRVEGFTNADYARSPSSRRFTMRYFTIFGGNLVIGQSKKHNVIARSSAEAEYRTTAHTASELNSLWHFLYEIGFLAPITIPLFWDNQVALYIAFNPVFHERTKHIEVDCHFVRNKILSGDISTLFVKSKNQLVDIFTKSLCTNRLVNLFHARLIWKICSSLRGER